MKHLKYILVVMLNGAKRNEASQICTCCHAEWSEAQ